MDTGEDLWVGRLGLEPRTHGLKEDRWSAKSALPARLPLMYARKAPIAQSFRWCSFHESFRSVGAPSGGFGH